MNPAASGTPNTPESSKNCRMNRMALAGRIAAFAFGWLVLAVPASASLFAMPAGRDARGPVDLLSSSVKVTVGSEWLDVEEEAELQVRSGYQSVNGAFQLAGEIVVPPKTLVTGCLFWRGDSLVKGKLRLHAKAVDTFTHIVNDTSKFSSDPLLLEQKSETVLSLRAYPFLPGEFRKIRIRYLVPVTSRTGEVPILPLFSQVNGERPEMWALQLRGSEANIRLRGTGWSRAVKAPSLQMEEFPFDGNLALVWGSNDVVGGTRAVFNRVASGDWAGDYALYSGKIPDSLARKVEIRSETVVLWRWIQPETFSQACGDTRCLTDFGMLAARQASQILSVAQLLAGEGNKVGLVADLARDEPPIVKPLGDSASSRFVDMESWLSQAGYEYVVYRSGQAVSVPGMDLEKNRSRLANDLKLAAGLFGTDTGVVRHVLIVTVGPNPTGGDLQISAEDSALPPEVSVSSTIFDGADSVWNRASGRMEVLGYSRGIWPGVQLRALEEARKGSRLAWISNVRIPASRNFARIDLSIAAGGVPLVGGGNVTKGRDGNWIASLNLFAKGLGKDVSWTVSDENGTALAEWTVTPKWVELTGDSIVPRLWSVADGRVSTPDRKDLMVGTHGNLYGYVDAKFSLLALPGDLVSPDEALSLADSGVPFLKASEIFADSYKRNDSTPSTAIKRKGAHRPTLDAVAMPLGRIRIDFGGATPRTLQILDVQGRVVREWSVQELAGRTRIVWSRDESPGSRGAIFLVRLATQAGTLSVPVALP